MQHNRRNIKYLSVSSFLPPSGLELPSLYLPVLMEKVLRFLQKEDFPCNPQSLPHRHNEASLSLKEVPCLESLFRFKHAHKTSSGIHIYDPTLKKPEKMVGSLYRFIKYRAPYAMLHLYKARSEQKWGIATQSSPRPRRMF